MLIKRHYEVCKVFRGNYARYAGCSPSFFYMRANLFFLDLKKKENILRQSSVNNKKAIQFLYQITLKNILRINVKAKRMRALLDHREIITLKSRKIKRSRKKRV